MKLADIPNPGSKEAIRQGCVCPILDNAHGQGIKNGTQFWINSECPIHGKEAYNKAIESIPKIEESITKNKKSIVDNIVKEMLS